MKGLVGGDGVSLVGGVFTLTPALTPVSSTGQALRERGSLIGIHVCLQTFTYPCKLPQGRGAGVRVKYADSYQSAFAQMKRASSVDAISPQCLAY